VPKISVCLQIGNFSDGVSSLIPIPPGSSRAARQKRNRPAPADLDGGRDILGLRGVRRSIGACL
jgi:hypothetical protein